MWINLDNQEKRSKVRLSLQLHNLKAHSHNAFFSNRDCDSSYDNKWVVRDSMEVFTLCDCDNITGSIIAHCKQKQITQCERTFDHGNENGFTFIQGIKLCTKRSDSL